MGPKWGELAAENAILSRTPSGGAFWEALGSILGGFWIHFGDIWGWILACGLLAVCLLFAHCLFLVCLRFAACGSFLCSLPCVPSCPLFFPCVPVFPAFPFFCALPFPMPRENDLGSILVFLLLLCCWFVVHPSGAFRFGLAPAGVRFLFQNRAKLTPTSIPKPWSTRKGALSL